MTEALTPKAKIGFGSGDPAGFPGYRPMNPWGRAMPKPVRQPREALWQIVVKMPGGKREPIGPRMAKDAVESMLYEMNKAAIETGGKVWWAEPEIVCVSEGGNVKPSSALRVHW